MTYALEQLVALLDLDQLTETSFRGRHPAGERQRTFGGQIAAQALMAAGRTVSRGRVHSLHSYFLLPGDSSLDTEFEVDKIRDGRSFATRRVVAWQQGRAIYNLQASFHEDEQSLEHQLPMPEVAPPEEVATLEARIASELGEAERWRHHANPIEQRYLGALPWGRDRDHEARERLWIRADGLLGDDPLLHAGVVTYASDMNLFDAMLGPHDVDWTDGTFMGASLDHCMWFHREVRADDWLLYDMESPIAHGGRALARGFLFSRDGLLRVSMVQEGLTRKMHTT